MARPCVLVVEDEPFIALDLVATLVDAGFAVAGPVGTVPAALDELRAQRPDAAIIDVNLNGKASTPVAAALQAARVPFVVVTAYSSAANFPEFRDSLVLFKPVPPHTLLKVVRMLLEEDAGGGPAKLSAVTR